MKRIKTILIAIVTVLGIFAVGAAAQSVIMNAQQKNVGSDIYQPSFFDAEITFYIYEGTGCGCVPLVGAFVNATSGDGADFQVTDENGSCLLHMVINSEYRVTIEANNFNTVMFDYDVIDNQYFRFHMGAQNSDLSQSLSIQSQKVDQNLLHHISLEEGKNNAVK